MQDPMEKLIRDALIDIGEPFVEENKNLANLDFYLPRINVYIEVKQFHSKRISNQMERASNVIVAQGKEAIEALASMIKGTF